MTSAQRYYRFAIGFGIFASLTVLAALAAVPIAIDLSAPSQGELLDACRQLLSSFSVPALLISALGALGVACAFSAIRSVVRHLRAQHRLLRHLDVLDRIVAGGVDAGVFRCPRPQAFCVGLLRPRIYLSTGTVDILDARELDAVLAHEAHHAARRDPLRVLVARVLRDALFFLPVMGHVAERYAALAEIAADEAAVRRSGQPGPLASAMLTFDERAPAGAVGIAPERVDHLLGEDPRWKLSSALVAGALLTLAALVLTAAAAAASAPTEGVSTTMLIMQLCTVVAASIPLVGGAALILTVKRALSR
ncbi:MAG: M56 family metallopeptidase [Solirubrobacteraceae bacterium]